MIHEKRFSITQAHGIYALPRWNPLAKSGFFLRRLGRRWSLILILILILVFGLSGFGLLVTVFVGRDHSI